MTSKNKDMERDQFLVKARTSLTEMKTKLMREIATQLRNEREGTRDECLDSSDLASVESDREVSSMLSERDRLKVGQIDDALRRIASLKYGLCETCGLEITAERLDAMPFTRLCCDCQQDREREAKTRRYHEERDDGGYKFGSVPAQEELNRDPLRSTGE
jgi:DnaK suppressor protein